jgi:uncharacterized membrane protein
LAEGISPPSWAWVRYWTMTTTRLEAFSDAVIAIVITIMVLELRVPSEPSLVALRKEVGAVFLVYVLSFVNLAIYWNNHHHLMVLTDRINGKILWANIHLLFWLSLVPFTTGWMGENDFAALPTAVYGVDLLLAAIAYFILQTAIIAAQGPESKLRAALGHDLKGKASPLLYIGGISMASVSSRIALGFYVFVALMWLIPDRRIESVVTE